MIDNKSTTFADLQSHICNNYEINKDIIYRQSTQVNKNVQDRMSNITYSDRKKKYYLMHLSQAVHGNMDIEETYQSLMVIEAIAKRSQSGTLLDMAEYLDIVLTACICSMLKIAPKLQIQWLMNNSPHIMIKYIFPISCQERKNVIIRKRR